VTKANWRQSVAYQKDLLFYILPVFIFSHQVFNKIDIFFFVSEPSVAYLFTAALATLL
jgi:hypothetical protein